MILDPFQPQQFYDSVVPYPGIQNLNNCRSALTCAILMDVSGETGTWKWLSAKTVGIRDHEKKSKLVFSRVQTLLCATCCGIPQQHVQGGKHTWALLSLSLSLSFSSFCFKRLQLAKDPATKLFWDSKVLVFADLTQGTMNHHEHFID